MANEYEVKYQAGNVTGGYAFSANDKKITLSGYVEGLPDGDKTIIIFEAATARENYVNAVAAKKAAGEKVNPLTIKREAVAAAQKATVEKFGEEEYNRVKAVMDSHKGGAQSVSGKTRKSGEKAAKPAKAPKTPKAPPADADLDLEDFGDMPADDFDAGVAPDPFDEI